MINISTNNNNNNNNNSLQIKQGDKFFSRLLSKESSMASPSSRRLYYAGLCGSVPFLWESQPGTPKIVPFCDDHHDQLRDSRAYRAADHDDYHHLPPLTLTPPPSYFFNNNKIEKLDHHHHKRSRSYNLLSSIFPKKFNVGYNALMIKHKPGQLSSVSRPNNGSESSSMLDHHIHCLACSPTTAFRARSASAGAGASWFSSSSSSTMSFDSRGEGEEVEEVGYGSPNSKLCFFGCYRR